MILASTSPPLKLQAMRRQAEADYKSFGDARRWTTAPKNATPVPAIVAGIDIREYTHGSDSDQQYIMSTITYQAIDEAVSALVRLGYSREETPVIIQHTGDGALVVFDCWECMQGQSAPKQLPPKGCPLKECPLMECPLMECSPKECSPKECPLKGRQETDEKDKSRYLCGRTEKGGGFEPKHYDCIGLIDVAFAFLFTLNVILWNRAREYTEAGKLKHRLRQRFAMSLGSIHLVPERDDGLGCVGPALVNCARILSLDHGGHFLLQQEILDFVERRPGGLDDVCGGQWKHELYVDELPSRTIKYGEFRCANIFGKHSDRPLLRALHRFQVEDRKFRIGAHGSSAMD